MGATLQSGSETWPELHRGPQESSSSALPLRLDSTSTSPSSHSASSLTAAHGTYPLAAHEIDSRAMTARGGSADAAEGVTAFLEKREAVFPDRVSDGLPAVGL
jgi:hypothetical protein